MRVLAILLLCSPAVGQWQTAAPERSAFVTAKPVIGTATQEPEAAPVVKAPHIIATVADRGCPPCDRWETETLPALEKAGWRVQVNRVAFGSEATPSFRCGSRVLEGYTTRAAFYSWVKPTGPSATGAVKIAVRSAPVVSSVPRDPRGGHWSHPGDIFSHLRTHGIDPTGMTTEQAKTAHDIVHEVERGWLPASYMSTLPRLGRPRTTYAAPVASTAFCPTCPR